MTKTKNHLVRDIQKEKSFEEKQVVISIVIAARNECKLIGECLQSVTTQNFPLPYEVIVVDNASEDNTTMIAKKFGCMVVNEPRIGQLFAKSSGVKASSAEFVAVLDADCVPEPDWLIEIYESLKGSDSRRRIVAVTCVYQFNLGLPWWAHIYIAFVNVFL